MRKIENAAVGGKGNVFKAFWCLALFLLQCFAGISPAYALSAGCTAVNALSGSTSLFQGTNSYPASTFAAADALTVTFTDSGGGYGGVSFMTDYIGLDGAGFNPIYKTYHSSDSTSNTPHTETVTIPAGTLSTYGFSVGLQTTYGQISNVTFSCGGPAASTVATLGNLAISAGTLAPSFASGTTSYTASVANAVATITVTPTTTDTNATVTVNGSPVASGSASPPINLTAGASTNIPVVVTAQDNTTIVAYTLQVTRAGAAPVANNVSATVAANTSNNPITLSLSGGAAASVAIASAPAHGSANASGTSISYSPNAGYSGVDSFTYTATNASGTSAAATVSVTVGAPTLAFAPATGATLAAGAVGAAYTVPVAASQGQGPYAYSASGLPAGLAINGANGTISGTPTAAGTFTLTVTATDANGVTGSATYNLTIAQQAPVANNVSATVTANSSNTPITLSLSGGTAASVAIASAPAHGSATASGTSISYTPSAGYSGADSFTYTATNASGTSAAATVSITVGAPMLAFSPASGATLAGGTVGSAYTAAIIASLGQSPYAYSATGLPAGMSINGVNGTISGTPTAAGAFSVTVTATDANGASGSATYSLTVAQQAPVANNVSATVAANSSNTTIALSVGGGAAVSVAVASAPAHGSATASGTLITYSPIAGYSGADSFTYTATNATGTSAAATVSIIVGAPTLALSPATGATLAGATVGSAYTQAVSASLGQSPYAYSATGLPAGLAINGANGAISGTPTAAGVSTVIVTASDANGAAGSATYSLTVVPQAPVAGAVSATVQANTSNNPLSLALSGGAVTSVTIASAPSHGSASVSGTSISYTPRAGYTGTDSFTYTATNAGGSSTATIQVTVRPAPLAVYPADGALPAGAVNVAYSQVVSASGGIGPYAFAATGLPAGLAIAALSGTISGTPTAPGNFTPVVTVIDATGATRVASYSLYVAPLAPLASDVTATVAANSTGNAITLNVGGGAATTVTIRSAARHGDAAVSGAAITYTPHAGYSGPDSFAYSVSNASGTSNATVNLVVTAPVLAVTPVAGATLNATLGVAFTQTIAVSGGTAPYRFSANGLPTGFTLDTATGAVTCMPVATGKTTFSVTATDAYGVQVQASYTLAVVGVAPVARNQTVTLYAGQAATVNLSDGATGGPFTGAAILDEPDSAQGTARLSVRDGAQVLTFTAAAKASGAIVIHYTLTNSWGTSTPATVTLQVTARPDPSRDPEVIGLLNAQAQSAEQFANAQIGNFNDRLERLHGERSRHDQRVDIRLGLPNPRQPRQGQAPEDMRMKPAIPAVRQADAADDAAIAPRSAREETPHADNRLAAWVEGFVDFGSVDRQTVRLSHSLAGLSAGADYRFLPAFVAGFGIGYGHDLNDVGNSGTQSRGDAFSAAFYGSYHPGPVYVDGLLGHGRLSFDSRRFVTQSAGYANGERSGSQVFGALSSGYEMRSDATLFAPYGRMQFSSTQLDRYREHDAGAFDLAYANQRLTMVSAVAGARGEHGVPMTWGTLTLRGRVEYRHALRDTSTARLGYADSDDSSYAVSVLGQSKNQLTTGLGVDFALPWGLTAGFSYQGMFGMGDHMRNHQIRVHASSHF